jgi:hypothetical protein
MAEMVSGIEGMRQLERKLNKLHKRYAETNARLRLINETAANLFARAMRRAITSSDKTIHVSRDGRKPLKIKPGTYKRSIGAWLVNDDGNAYWAGPRTGRKVGKTKDAWFSYIVESDQQYIEGTNHNAGVIEQTIQSRSKGIEAWRFRQLQAYQKQVESELARTQ